MNWVDVLGGLLAHDVIQDWRQQRQQAKAMAAGWIPPEQLPWVADDAWQATEEVMFDAYDAALASAQAALPDNMAASSVMISWARDAVPRLAQLHRTFEDVVISCGASRGNLAYDLFHGAYMTIGVVWLPAAQRMANATGYPDVSEGMAMITDGRRSWARFQQRMGVPVGATAPTPAPAPRPGPVTAPTAHAASGQSRPMKTCPDCAESILAAARLCRFCRHEFWAEEGPAPPPPPRS